MNKNITMLNRDTINSSNSNYVSNVLKHTYNQHERFGDGKVMTLQILLELQALITDEINDIKNIIIDDELSQLWISGSGDYMTAGRRPVCDD
jgi:hypothetical protein